jgi:hypothetical protein
MQIQVKCHRPNRTYPTPHFFILSKGKNAGKPLQQPCPNCFVMLANNEVQRDQLYWLCFGLWQTGYFWQFLVGSVVPFIHVEDLRDTLRRFWIKMYNNPENFLKAVKALNDILTLQKNLDKQLLNIHRLKKEIIHNALRSAGD